MVEDHRASRKGGMVNDDADGSRRDPGIRQNWPTECGQI